MRLLCLSNGHGEDTIAVKILQALQAIDPDPGYAVLPLVGDGKAYDALSMPKVGETKAMPSGGFVYMDGRQLMRDLHGGLLQLTWQQLRTIKHWGKKPGFVLAVGDLVPLLFAWWSGLPYAFVGTAKSEYYLRDEVGPLQRQSWWARREGWSGSVYLPWERWFMHHKRCQAIFPRDRLTADVLQTFDLPVYDLGNPMMDGLMDYTKSQAEDDSGAPLIIALLPGSRAPEAIDNWTRILQSLDPIAQIRPVPEWNRPQLRFVAAIAPGLDLAPLHQALEQNGWSARQSMGALDLPGEFALDTHGFRKGRLHLYISQQSFAQTLGQAHFAIATAGTATEQFVGLGKPAVTLVGSGPQFNTAFAEAQTRLLGASVTLVEMPEQVAPAIEKLLADPDRLQLIADNGCRRMGQPGAAQRIAEQLVRIWQQPNAAFRSESQLSRIANFH